MRVLDYIVLGVSLAVVLLIGYLSGRKSSSAKEFLMASKSINKLQAGFSMAVTDFGGSALVAAVGYSYVIGMSGMWWNLAAAPAFLLVGLFLAGKFNQMDGATVPDYLGRRYCPAVKYLTCFMHVCANVAQLSVQFTVACATLQTITGIDMNVSLVISVLLVVLLTSGGLRAVVNTDAALFVIVVVSVLATVPLTLHAGGGLHSIMARLPDGFMNVTELGFWTPLSWFVLCTLSYSTNQHYVQRMVAAKNAGTARFGAVFTAAFYLVVSLALGLLGVAAAVLMPGIADTNTVFPQLLVQYLPQGLIGLGIAGVFAATISTGTSILHSAATLVVNDLWRPLLGKNRTDRQELWISRALVWILALLSMSIAFSSGNIIDTVYVAGLFYSVSVFMPMVFGMKTKFATSRGAIVSVIGTVALSLAWEYILRVRIPALENFPSNIFGLLVSAVLLAGVSLLDRRQAGRLNTPE